MIFLLGFLKKREKIPQRLYVELSNSLEVIVYLSWLEVDEKPGIVGYFQLQELISCFLLLPVPSALINGVMKEGPCSCLIRTMCAMGC